MQQHNTIKVKWHQEDILSMGRVVFIIHQAEFCELFQCILCSALGVFRCAVSALEVIHLNLRASIHSFVVLNDDFGSIHDKVGFHQGGAIRTEYQLTTYRTES